MIFKKHSVKWITMMKNLKNGQKEKEVILVLKGYSYILHKLFIANVMPLLLKYSLF